LALVESEVFMTATGLDVFDLSAQTVARCVFHVISEKVNAGEVKTNRADDAEGHAIALAQRGSRQRVFLPGRFTHNDKNGGDIP
jgi:hypothetical protein